jgi:hypothetical protein
MVLSPLNYLPNSTHYTPQALSGQFGAEKILAPAENKIANL